ncbi:polysaccharide deacetylase family protein [Sphingomonas carotinifaciens]|uniref:polysaccharide deacetylase family protein n=1 Tax=Sphingomonas carotinifaciens TaxID=1166323 RepID=UPI001F075940|nr:polysaccharide deacetylase family protein [Sphingomonas carotinifaciens]
MRGPFRMPAVERGERVRWPADFGRRFMVFVDVEEEFDWAAPFTRSDHTTTAIRALPAAHRRFADAGVALTMMVDAPMAADPEAVAILRDVADDGRATIGAQLHGWVTPPFEEVVGVRNSYAGNLPPALEAAKIDHLTHALTEAFGRPPIAFRSGRYGLGQSTLGMLAARGYRIDGSVRAYHDYSDHHGPDFAAIGPAAFVRDGMLELPLSTAFIGAARSQGPWIYPKLARLPLVRGGMARSGMMSRVALTPEGMPVAAVIAAIDALLAGGEQLLVFSFHSPSLAPGHTPYVRDARDLSAFWEWWEMILDHLAERRVVPASLADVLTSLDQRPAGADRAGAG